MIKGFEVVMVEVIVAEGFVVNVGLVVEVEGVVVEVINVGEETVVNGVLEVIVAVV